MPRSWPPGDPSTLGDVEHLVALLSAGDVVVLSGAGMSTDSGIPDYRGPDGARRRGPPMTHQEFVASAHARRRYWARSHVGWAHVARARPNAAHHAVMRLERAGLVRGVITQNVDGLHTAAGSRHVIDLHGRLDAVRCLACGDRRSRLELALRLDALNPQLATAAQIAPDGDAELAGGVQAGFRMADCRRCDGVLMPDVVFFGGSVPPERVQAATTLLDDARVLLVLGTSLSVMSGYRFVVRARRAGTSVAIVTRGRTRGDADASLRLDASLADVLPATADALVEGAPDPAAPSRAVGAGR